MQKEEARIAAHVCGDGWLTKYLERNSLQIVNGRRYRRERIRYVIGYCNNEKLLLEQFENDMMKIFDLKPIRVRTELRFRSKRVFDRLSYLGAGKSREWFIGKEIRKANRSVKKEWIKAFFDDESTSNFRYGRIQIKSINLRGLRSIKRLLKDFNIQSNITGRNIDNTWYLNMTRENTIKYYKNIGFDHPIKKSNLKNLVIKLIKR